MKTFMFIGIYTHFKRKYHGQYSLNHAWPTKIFNKNRAELYKLAELWLSYPPASFKNFMYFLKIF